MTYKELEDDLFKRWILESNKNKDGGKLEFVKDGLLFKGRIEYENGFWTRYPGDESNNWHNSKVRILVLTKDLNGDPWDIRSETGRKNNCEKGYIKINTRFYKNYMNLCSGIFELLNNNKLYTFKDIGLNQKSRKTFEHMPLVRMNCKKQAGTSSISNSKLKKYLDKYKSFIIEQLDIYDANIILCCGGSSIIKNFVAKEYIKDLELINYWIYYSRSTKKIIIDSYHFSYIYSHEQFYKDLMNSLNDALKNIVSLGYT